MRYLLFFMLLIPHLLFSQTTLKIEEGWQLMGVARQIDDMALFNRESVEIIWSYDARQQKWQGYSANSEIQSKIIGAGYTLIRSLKPYQAFWVHSTDSAQSDLASADNTPDTPQNEHLQLVDLLKPLLDYPLCLLRLGNERSL